MTAGKSGARRLILLLSKTTLQALSPSRVPVMAPDMTGTLLGDKAWSVVFDNSKIKRLAPDFPAVIPFREGIRRTLAWFDADEGRRRVEDAVNEEMDRILAAYARSDD